MILTLRLFGREIIALRIGSPSDGPEGLPGAEGADVELDDDPDRPDPMPFGFYRPMPVNT